MRTNKLIIVGALAWATSAGCFPTYVPEGAAPLEKPKEGPTITVNTSEEPVSVRPIDPAQDANALFDRGDASRLLDIISIEGTPDQASRLHACLKMRYDTIGRLLLGRGVSMGTLPVTAATTCPAKVAPVINAQSASFLYCDSRVTLGLPQYPARIAEAAYQTAASAVKMHDLYLAAANDVIAAFGTNTSPVNCRISGQAVTLFEANNSCSKDGVACLIGYPPGADLLNLCSQLVTGADSIANGKRIAVGALLAVAHMCE